MTWLPHVLESIPFESILLLFVYIQNQLYSIIVDTIYSSNFLLVDGIIVL